MNKKETFSLRNLVLSAVLAAIGIIIPLTMPKIPFGDSGSMTLAFHVPVTIAMFISPISSIAVCIISATGFWFTGLPPIVPIRAYSQLFFVLIGAILIKKGFAKKISKLIILVSITTLVHASAELAASLLFKVISGSELTSAIVAADFISVFIITVVHGILDYIIALAVIFPLSRAGFINKNLLFYNKNN